MLQLGGEVFSTECQLISPTDDVASGIQAAAAEEMRLDIACQITDLFGAVPSLKSKQNQLLPISRLPPEVLLDVFSYLAHSSETAPLSRRPLGHPCPWIAISHVSRRWRNMAINSACLWTDLPLTNRKWTEEMLKRSKMAPISINLTSNSLGRLNAGGDILQPILAEISRAREVRFPFVPLDMACNLFNNFPQSAPNLKTLELGVCSETPNQAQGFILPDRALCEAPVLQSLTLRGIQINWKSQLLCDLKHLSLHAETKWSRPVLADFVEALRRTPKLESLSLDGCFPVSQMSLSVSVPTVTFPRLRELALSGLTSEVAVALRYLSIPHSSKVKLVCNGTQAPGPAFDSILSTFVWARNSTHETEPMPIQSISLQPGPSLSVNPCRLQFQAWTALIPIQKFKSRNRLSLDKPNMDLILSWTQPDSYFSSNKLIQTLFSTLSLDSTCSLHGQDVNVAFDTIVEVFGTLPRLASLSAEGDSFTKIVVESLLDSATTPAPSLPFPSLRELVLTGAQFEGNRWNSLTMDTLQDCFIQRYECGGEIQTLRLEECISMDEGDEIPLQEIIVDVLWDGQIIYSSDSSDEDNYDDDADYIWSMLHM